MSVATQSGLGRIERAFATAGSEGRVAIVVYVTVGFPTPGETAGLLRAALDGGADVIELGVPFSDPMADGATIQRANEVALGQGVTLADCIAEGASLVRDRDAAVLLMGYLNPFTRYGRALSADLQAAGIAGVIVPDLPAEESAELDASFVPAGLARIDMYAPTTPDARLERLLPSARGFVYCVSLTGVTGARTGLPADVGAFVARIRARTSVPIALGFGISSSDHVRALAAVVDGVVVGSAAIDAIGRAAPGRREVELRGFIRSLREAGER